MTVSALKLAGVTDLRSRTSYQPDCAALARNRIAMARSSAGMSPGEFAAVLTRLAGRAISGGHVIAWETKATPPGDVLEAADMISPSSPLRLGFRSHKFIAGYVGPAAAAAIASRTEASPGSFAGMDCRSALIRHPAGRCTLHVWPFGSAIFHLAEDLEVSGVATLALWRVRSYEENIAWASEHLRELAGDDGARASYVLSAYWVRSPIWAGQLLATGMRLICCPRVLLERGADGGDAHTRNAEEAERALLAEGYEHAGIRAFGMRGISAGYASWSGVSYHPADPDRALAEAELVSLELGLQSVWAYAEHIGDRAEEGRDPGAPEGYGWRFLRAARSRLVNPRPQETGQHQAMREAIVETSRVPGLLSQAIEVLREDGIR
jgi:hypothetical protein